MGGRLRQPVEQLGNQVVPAGRCGERERGLGVRDPLLTGAAVDGVLGRRDEHLQCVLRFDLRPGQADMVRQPAQIRAPVARSSPATSACLRRRANSGRRE